MAKRLATAFSRIVVLPLVLTWRAYHQWTGREALFVTWSQMLSLIPGTIGVYLRRAYYSSALSTCGRDVYVGFGTWFSHAVATIGNGVYIGAQCTVGMVDIRDRAMIGSNVDILSGRRQHRRGPDHRLTDSREGIFERLVIGEDAWIGNSAVILAAIGERCTVGAGSVVVKPVSDGRTVVGNPAREVETT